MNITYPVSSANPRLLLIFAGWSAVPGLFAGVAPAGYDVAVATDYTTLSAPEAEGLERYGEIAVMAWSFGVAEAARFMAARPHLRYTARIAVNGTLHPVHPTLGIPPEIFRGTLEGLSERSFRKFGIRMCGGAKAYADGPGALEQRPVESLRAELAAIGERGDAPVAMWDRTVVSLGDAIVPPEAQKRAWSTEAYETIEIDGPHLPDFAWLTETLLTDKELVERRFSRSRNTYASQAPVQERVARRLADMLPASLPEGRVIEIGCGSGLSTRMLSVRPDIAGRIELWDLRIPDDVRPLGQSWRECDAEAALPALSEGSCALLFSASTVQWFNSLPAFLRSAARALAPGGVLAVATYGPRTMEQIHTAAGTMSRFPSPEAIRRMVPPELETEVFETGVEILPFDSPIDVLRHIKATGVNGMADAGRAREAARAILRRYPADSEGRVALTYQPVLFIMRKKS